jgi:carbonic anhydrase
MIASFPISSIIMTLPDELLKELKERPKREHSDPKRYRKHSPKYTVLMCSDARLQTDLLSETPEHKLFVVRNIGNQLYQNAGSLDYGIKVLKTPYLLIVGHSDCGAVKAVRSGTKVDPTIGEELIFVESKGVTLGESVINNVHKQVSHALNRYGDLVSNGELMVIGLHYNFLSSDSALQLVNINGVRKSSA